MKANRMFLGALSLALCLVADGVLGQQQQQQDGESAAAAQSDQQPTTSAGKMPVLLVRQKQGNADQSKPDIYLGWLDWPGMSAMKPFMQPVQQNLGPYTQQITQLLLDRMPGAQGIYEQFNDTGSQLSSTFNPASFLGNLGGGGSGSGESGASSLPGSLSNLIPNLGRR